MRQQIGLDTGLSDMMQLDVPQRDGELTDYRKARRRAWMEEYREEGREEGRQEELRINLELLVQATTCRFGPHIGQRLANVWPDADYGTRFEQVLEVILNAVDGKELLRRLDDNFG